MAQKANRRYLFLLVSLMVLFAFVSYGRAQDNDLSFSYRGGFNISGKFNGWSWPFLSGAKTFTEDPQRGFEMAYARRVSSIAGVYWGLEGAVNVADASIGHTFTRSKTIYPDPFDRFAFDPFYYVATDKRELEATLYGLRFGTWLRVPLTKALSCSTSGGLAAGLVDSEFKITGFNNFSTWDSYKLASGEASDTMLGWYAAVLINYSLSEHLGLNLGAQYQNLGTFSRHIYFETVEVDLRSSVFVTAGVSWFF